MYLTRWNYLSTCKSFFVFQKLKIVSNMLELANASFNFYMYCLCNKEIRLQVWSLLSLRFLRRNISQQGHDTSSTTKQARVHRNPSELFPEVFNKKGQQLRRLSSNFLLIRKKSWIEVPAGTNILILSMHLNQHVELPDCYNLLWYFWNVKKK